MIIETVQVPCSQRCWHACEAEDDVRTILAQTAMKSQNRAAMDKDGL